MSIAPALLVYILVLKTVEVEKEEKVVEEKMEEETGVEEEESRDSGNDDKGTSVLSDITDVKS